MGTVGIYPEFDCLLDELLEDSGADAAELFLKESAGGHLWLAAHRGLAANDFQQRTDFKMGEGFPGLVAERGRPIVTSDLSGEERYLRSRVKSRGFKSYRCVPVYVGDEVVGSLNIASRGDIASSGRQKELLDRVAKRLGEMIDIGRLRARDAASRPVADPALDPKSNLARKMEHALAAMVDFTGAKGGIVLLQDQSTGALNPWCWRGSYESACTAVLRMGGKSCPCLTIKQRRGIVAPARPGNSPKPCSTAPSGMRQIVCLPLVVEERVLGAVSLGYREKQQPPGRLLAVLDSMVERMAADIADALVSVEAERRAMVVSQIRTLSGVDAEGEASKGRQLDATLEHHHEGTPFLDFRCFGKLDIFRDGHRVAPANFKRRRAQRLLKILLTNYGKPVHREVLIELLWPDGPPMAAEKQLKVLVHDLRCVLQPGSPPHERKRFIILSGEGYALDTTSPHCLDSQDFIALIKGARRLEQLGERKSALAAYQSAVGLYTGDFLEDERYSDWCASERVYLRETYLSALRKIAELLSDSGDVEGAIACYRSALRSESTMEDIHRDLMRLLWQSGRRDDALRQYRAFCDQIERETGARPHPETERLYRQIEAATVKQ